jgi:hypothetical protein
VSTGFNLYSPTGSAEYSATVFNAASCTLEMRDSNSPMSMVAKKHQFIVWG